MNTELDSAYEDKFLESGDIVDMLSWLRHLRERRQYERILEVCTRYYAYYSEQHEFLNELGICFYRRGELEKSWHVYQRILQQCRIPLSHAQLYHQNGMYSFSSVWKESPAPHDVQLQAISANLRSDALITFTITTCKRLDLFLRTMDSFLFHCRDISLISRWICVDDQSSEADRAVMQERYPFMEFVWKTELSKGHAKSMNLIVEQVRTPYMFHMEDDWQFFTPHSYIRDMLSVMNTQSKYGQCLLNRNYAETVEDVDLRGGVLKETSEGVRYVEHTHRATSVGRSNEYWPHYSLRPGLVRMATLRAVGRFREDVSHFEREYANRYAEQGYITTFLDRIHCIHIGKLTHEEGVNAYTLNGMRQF